MNLKALTSKELDTVLEAIDAIHAAHDLLEAAGVLTDDVDTADLACAVIEEMAARALEDVSYAINRMVARGELDRYMRPDGQVGYAPPGAWDELE